MGIKKTLLIVGGLMLASGGPVTLYSAADRVNGIKRSWLAGPAAATASATPGQSDPAAAAPSAVASSAAPATNPVVDATPMPSLAEVLRFDVTPSWVMQRWPRVSTGLPYTQLQGYRVPLVSGTSLADVAGSLTYYFNSQQQVQRIALRGTTGDPSALVALLTNRYHFTRRLTNDPGVVLFEAVDSGNQPAGSLKIRSAPVVKSNQPYTRFEVDLVMDRTE
jgi:hypothetical protein